MSDNQFWTGYMLGRNSNRGSDNSGGSGVSSLVAFALFLGLPLLALFYWDWISVLIAIEIGGGIGYLIWRIFAMLRQRKWQPRTTWVLHVVLILGAAIGYFSFNTVNQRQQEREAKISASQGQPAKGISSPAGLRK